MKLFSHQEIEDTIRPEEFNQAICFIGNQAKTILEKRLQRWQSRTRKIEAEYRRSIQLIEKT